MPERLESVPIGCEKLPELFANKEVRGEGHSCRQFIDGEKPCFFRIGARTQGTTGCSAQEPHPHSLPLAVVKVGMNLEDRPEDHVDTGFFLHLPPGAAPDVLIPLHVTARNAPHAAVGRAAPLDEEQLSLFHENYGDADRRVLVLDKIAPGADTPQTPASSLVKKTAAAFWTVLEAHGGRFFEKGPISIRWHEVGGHGGLRTRRLTE
jgi:hypothetical protein